MLANIRAEIKDNTLTKIKLILESEENDIQINWVDAIIEKIVKETREKPLWLIGLYMYEDTTAPRIEINLTNTKNGELSPIRGATQYIRESLEKNGEINIKVVGKKYSNKILTIFLARQIEIEQVPT